MGHNNYFQFKQFRINQEKSAMRVGTDGVLLGAWTDVSSAVNVLDVGTGTGLIAIMLAQRSMAKITGVEIEVQAAIEAKQNALPTYSKFHVGAALLTEDNKIYTGSNVESSSYSLTMCAERNAIFKAISEGERKFKAIAIASDDSGFCPPCGSCRQVLNDFCSGIEVVLINKENELKILKLEELIPLPFGDANLK